MNELRSQFGQTDTAKVSEITFLTTHYSAYAVQGAHISPSRNKNMSKLYVYDISTTIHHNILATQQNIPLHNCIAILGALVRANMQYWNAGSQPIHRENQDNTPGAYSHILRI